MTTTTNGTTATVQTLTAEVRVLMVGNRQITLSVVKQLDRVRYEELEPTGPSPLQPQGRGARPGRGSHRSRRGLGPLPGPSEAVRRGRGPAADIAGRFAMSAGDTQLRCDGCEHCDHSEVRDDGICLGQCAACRNADLAALPIYNLDD